MFSHAFNLGFLDFVVPNLFLSSFCHSISSHFPHLSKMPFALPFLMVTTATLAKRFIKKSKMTKMTLTKMTKYKNQAHSLWSEPD